MARRYSEVWLAAATVLLLGCADGDGGGGDEMCAAYACINGPNLHGTLTVAPELNLLDVRFCEDSACRSGLVDLQASTSMPCLMADPASVCLSLSGDLLTIDAGWRYAGNASLPQNRPAYQLVLTDHATGEVLLDETRTATFEVTREDNCHRCWGAELAL